MLGSSTIRRWETYFDVLKIFTASTNWKHEFKLKESSPNSLFVPHWARGKQFWSISWRAFGFYCERRASFRERTYFPFFSGNPQNSVVGWASLKLRLLFVNSFFSRLWHCVTSETWNHRKYVRVWHKMPLYFAGVLFQTKPCRIVSPRFEWLWEFCYVMCFNNL